MNPFELALKKKMEKDKREKHKNEKKVTIGYEMENIEYCGLSKEPKVIRILGVPYEVREKPTDCKIFYWSKIVNDSNQNFVHIIWKTNEEGELDKDWIWYRMYYKLTEMVWVDYKPGEIRDPNRPRSNEKGYYIYKYADTLSFKRLEKNKKENSNQFGHVRPKKRFVVNVIDRMDDWCKENKHSKILTSNHTAYEITTELGDTKTIYFTDKGAPFDLYNQIYSKVLEFRNTWDLDLAIWKEDRNYEIRDAYEEKIKPDIKKLMVKEPLTEEEKSYKMYDLDSLFRHTSYAKLLNNFEKFFKQVDIDLGTKFYNELLHHYEEEVKEYESKTKEEEIKGNSQTKVDIDIRKNENSNITQSIENGSLKRKQQKIEEVLKDYPYWDNLEESEKDCMISNCLSAIGENFKYKDGTSLIPCDCEKKIDFPDEVFSCIVCGKKFSL